MPTQVSAVIAPDCLLAVVAGIIRSDPAVTLRGIAERLRNLHKLTNRR